MSEPEFFKDMPAKALAVFLRQRDAGNPNWSANLADFIKGKDVEGAEEAISIIILDRLRSKGIIPKNSTDK